MNLWQSQGALNVCDWLTESVLLNSRWDMQQRVKSEVSCSGILPLIRIFSKNLSLNCFQPFFISTNCSFHWQQVFSPNKGLWLSGGCSVCLNTQWIKPQLTFNHVHFVLQSRKWLSRGLRRGGGGGRRQRGDRFLYAKLYLS